MPELDGKKYSYDKEGKKDFMKALKERRSQQSAAEKIARAKAMEKKKAVKGRKDSPSDEKTSPKANKPKPQRRYQKPNKRSMKSYLTKRKLKRGTLIGGMAQSGMRKYKKKAY